MDTRRHIGDPPHSSVEAVRDHEVCRLLSKLSLAPEHREAVENLSCSLLEELVHGPIAETAETVALVQEHCCDCLKQFPQIEEMVPEVCLSEYALEPDRDIYSGLNLGEKRR